MGLRGALVLFLLFSCVYITTQLSAGFHNVGTLSFETTQVLVNESESVVRICVHRTGSVNSFRLYTASADALASQDFGGFDGILLLWGDRQCYSLAIFNDDIEEPVEPFHVSLSPATSADAVTFINQTLTVYIMDDDAPSICTVNIVDTITEDRVRIVRNVRNLLPTSIPVSVPLSESSEEENITQVYEEIARALNRTTTSAGRTKFVAAMDEIFVAYRNECAGAPATPSLAELSRLAASFREATRQLTRIPEERLAEARAIYGRFLCYDELRRPTRAARRKRQETFTPSPECVADCPIAVTEPCHFFACLDVATFQFIAGFGNSAGQSGFDAPCIGFIVDTTGSMLEEIAAARDIVLQFMRSQADSTTCYVLVPFNDHDVGHPMNVGPITHAFTYGIDNTLVLEQLQQFEVAVNALRADGGGDYPEYSLDAMLAALNYSLIDEYGMTFSPMESSSKMVVITDASSKNEGLQGTVISRARSQDVAIHFILPSELSSYSVYTNIATQTGGNVYSSHHSSWSVVNFQLGLATSGPSGKKKRSAPGSARVSFNVSRFTSSLRLTAYSARSDFRSVTLDVPDASALIPAERNVVLYLKSDPAPGNYNLTADGPLDDVVIQQDTSLDASMLYTDSRATTSAFNPPPACTLGKIVLTTSRIGEISSLSLNETSPGGFSRLLPLTKCSNAFTRDHQFRSGTYYYQIQGVDTNGIDFAYNFNRSAIVTVPSSNAYSLRPTSTSPLTVEFSTQFTVEFVLRNNDKIGSTNFTLSANAQRFVLSLESSTVQLPPKQSHTIVITGRVGPTVGGGTFHTLTLTANNGCVGLRASRTLTVRALPMSISHDGGETSNLCGCQNGGTCNVRRRRGRTFTSCSCPPHYGGSRCEIGS